MGQNVYIWDKNIVFFTKKKHKLRTNFQQSIIFCL